jgi:hypothetical protein
MTEMRGCGGGEDEEHGNDTGNGRHRGRPPSTLILGLVPGIQPPRVGAARDEDRNGDTGDDHPHPRHPGPDPGSSSAMSIARETLMRALPARRKDGPLTAPTRGGWMPDQVRHDG